MRVRPAPTAGSWWGLRIVVAVAAGDDRAPAHAPGDDLDPRQRRALAAGASVGSPRRRRGARELRLGTRQRRGLAVFAPGTGRAGRRPLRSRQSPSRRRQLREGAGPEATWSCWRASTTARSSSVTATSSSSGRALRDVPGQPRQRRHAARRGRRRGVRALARRPRVRAPPGRVRLREGGRSLRGLGSPFGEMAAKRIRRGRTRPLLLRPSRSACSRSCP